MELKLKVRNSLLFVSMIVFMTSLNLQGQTFSKRIDWNNNELSEAPKSIEPTDDGYIIGVVGESPLSGWASTGFITINESGDVLSENIIESDSSATWFGFANSSDRNEQGEYFIAGSTQSISGNIKSLIIKYNSNGDTIWTRPYGVDNKEYRLQSGISSQDGGFLAVGTTDDFPNYNSAYNCAFVIKYSSEGELEWLQKYYQGSNQYRGYSIAELPNGNIALSGSHRPPGGSIEDRDSFIILTDHEGEFIWSHLYGNPYADGPGFVTSLSNGDILLHGNISRDDNPGGVYLFTARIAASSGQVIWEHKFESLISSICYWNKAIEDENGDLILSGHHQGPNEDFMAQDVMVIGKLSSGGDSLWIRQFLWDGEEQANGWSQDMALTPEGGYILAGYAWPTESYSQDVWILKLDEYGCLVPGCNTGIDNNTVNFEINLYPNPCSGYVQLSSEKMLGVSSIRVLDPVGRVISDLDIQINSNILRINTSEFYPGSYNLVCKFENGFERQLKFIKQ